NYDTLAMTGVANLGGTLRPIAQPALYRPTTTYLGVLTFASSTGRFATVAPASVFLAASAVYNAGSVDLVLTRLPFNSAGIGGGERRRANRAAAHDHDRRRHASRPRRGRGLRRRHL